MKTNGLEIEADQHSAISWFSWLPTLDETYEADQTTNARKIWKTRVWSRIIRNSFTIFCFFLLFLVFLVWAALVKAPFGQNPA